MASRTKFNFLSLAKARKTTFEFGTKKVSKGAISKILEAARWSPSSWNIQPWKFIVVKNPKTIDALNQICPFGGFHNEPALIIACYVPIEAQGGDYRGVVDMKVGSIEGLLSLAMPALNMCYMAHDLGVSSAILTPIPNETRKILNLKEGEFVPIMVGFGYERKGAYQKKKERKPLKEIVRYIN